MQTPQNRYKWLIFPVENFVREYYGKFLMSAVAAERGWGAIMAYKGYIRHNLPAITGVVVEMNMTNAERVERYLSLGWRVCAWDEEGLIYSSGDVYAHRRLNEAALQKLDRVFLWGENQHKDVVNHLEGIDYKLFLTGNPRFDLLRPDLREFYAPAAALLKNKHGRYILVNTTFGDVNHYFGRDYNLKILREAGKLTTKAQESDQIAREKYKEQLFRAFIEVLPALSAHFPEHKIIIRPHPAENFDTWSSAAKGLPNVVMIHEGDPIPWMLGADAVIHNSCTTGVQAYLLGRPVISYRPVRSDKYDMYLPNALSDMTGNMDQLIAFTRQLISNQGAIDQQVEKEKRLVAREYITSLEGPWAADRIMDELDKLDIHSQVFDNGYFNENGKDNLQPMDGMTILKNKVKHALMGMNSSMTFRDWLKQSLEGQRPVPPPAPEKDWETYRRQRFPTLSYNDIQSDLKRLQKVSGRFLNVRVGLTKNNIVYIYPIEN
jgi:surface carbohydrate biosynthesis protein